MGGACEPGAADTGGPSVAQNQPGTEAGLCAEETAKFYGQNGNESVDPVIIVKLMLLLFLDQVESERELLRQVPLRIDYLWFLGYGLEDETPNHSVLSKARAR